MSVDDAETSTDRDTTAAALVTIERDADERRIFVELSGSAAASGRTLDARSAVRDYLEEDDPPRHLIATTEGVRPAE